MWNRFQHKFKSKWVVESEDVVARADSARAIAASFLCFLAVGLLLMLPAINAPFFWDDLHLVRIHTPGDLARAWSGTYDVDQLESPGLRPLTMYFEHFRAMAFGENVAAHRVFLLVLFSLFLTMVAMLARLLFAANWWQILLGGLLGLLHIRSVSHYFWPTDGIFLASGLPVIGAVLAFLMALRSHRSIWLFVSFCCTALALFTREDSATLFALLVWFGLAYILMRKHEGGVSRLPQLSLWLFAAAMVGALAVYWYWRGAVAPNAVPLGINPAALPWAIAQTVQNAGDRQILDVAWLRYEVVISLWQVWLGGLLLIGLVCLGRRAKLIVLFWAGAILISATPLLVISRSDLLLLPVAFWGCLVAHVLAQFWRQFSATGWRVLATGMIVFALVVPTYGSFLFQQELRPSNLNWMCQNALLLYGVSGNATIPPARRASIQQQLAAYGISNLATFRKRWPAMNRKAVASGWFGVNAQDHPFVPRFRFLEQPEGNRRCGLGL